MSNRAAISIAVLLVVQLSSAVVAHDPKEFTVLLGEGGAVPTSVEGGVLVETDSLFFVNIDDRDGVSHRIQVDADGDGLFGGVDDFATQWLNGSCELDNNGTKLDTHCMVSEFLVLSPENGLLPGNISMRHQIRNQSGTSGVGFYASFGSDVHVESQPVLTTPKQESGGDGDAGLVLLLLSSLVGIIVIVPKLVRPKEGEED